MAGLALTLCARTGCERPRVYRDVCKSCYRKEWRLAHLEEVRAADRARYHSTGQASRVKRNMWRRHLRVKYGITPETYAALLAASPYCGICKREFGESTKACLDHCHETGTVRGFLCNACNVGLGSFNDNPELLEAALLWLV